MSSATAVPATSAGPGSFVTEKKGKSTIGEKLFDGGTYVLMNGVSTFALSVGAAMLYAPHSQKVDARIAKFLERPALSLVNNNAVKGFINWGIKSFVLMTGGNLMVIPTKLMENPPREN